MDFVIKKILNQFSQLNKYKMEKYMIEIVLNVLDEVFCL